MQYVSKIDLKDRRDRANIADSFKRPLDGLDQSSDEELQDVLKAMQNDQDSHSQQIMFYDLKSKLNQFYVYKELNRRGQYGARKPEPEEILDAKDVLALLHRLKTILFICRQISTGNGGYGCL
ncbi:hypothetical protein V8E36_005379 [Tilletia maclaganii]